MALSSLFLLASDNLRNLTTACFRLSLVFIGTHQERTSYQRQDKIRTFTKVSKAGQNSQTVNHTPLQEHAHTSMLVLFCSDESQLGTFKKPILCVKIAYIIPFFIFKEFFFKKTSKNTGLRFDL